MSEAVVFLTKARHNCPDWSKEEFGYLQRAAHLMRKLGIDVETDHGVTDEREPWFVICDGSSDEVIVHFCRTKDSYIAYAPFLESSLVGQTLAGLIDGLLDRHAAVVTNPN